MHNQLANQVPAWRDKNVCQYSCSTLHLPFICSNNESEGPRVAPFFYNVSFFLRLPFCKNNDADDDFHYRAFPSRVILITFKDKPKVDG